MSSRTGSSSLGNGWLNLRASSLSAVIAFFARSRCDIQSICFTVVPSGTWYTFGDVQVANGRRECPRWTSYRINATLRAVATGGARVIGICLHPTHRTVVTAWTLVAPTSSMLHSVGARMAGSLVARPFYSEVTRHRLHLGF